MLFLSSRWHGSSVKSAKKFWWCKSKWNTKFCGEPNSYTSSPHPTLLCHQQIKQINPVMHAETFKPTPPPITNTHLQESGDVDVYTARLKPHFENPIQSYSPCESLWNPQVNLPNLAHKNNYRYAVTWTWDPRGGLLSRLRIIGHLWLG